MIFKVFHLWTWQKICSKVITKILNVSLHYLVGEILAIFLTNHGQWPFFVPPFVNHDIFLVNSQNVTFFSKIMIIGTTNNLTAEQQVEILTLNTLQCCQLLLILYNTRVSNGGGIGGGRWKCWRFFDIVNCRWHVGVNWQIVGCSVDTVMQQCRPLAVGWLIIRRCFIIHRDVCYKTCCILHLSLQYNTIRNNICTQRMMGCQSNLPQRTLNEK